MTSASEECASLGCGLCASHKSTAVVPPKGFRERTSEAREAQLYIDIAVLKTNSHRMIALLEAILKRVQESGVPAPPPGLGRPP